MASVDWRHFSAAFYSDSLRVAKPPKLARLVEKLGPLFPSIKFRTKPKYKVKKKIRTGFSRTYIHML
jgi:hypothetical protein